MNFCKTNPNLRSTSHSYLTRPVQQTKLRLWICLSSCDLRSALEWWAIRQGDFAAKNYQRREDQKQEHRMEGSLLPRLRF